MDSNQSSLRFVAETVPGTTPATPAFKAIRMTGETLVANFETLVSNELNTNSDVNEVRRTSVSTSGEISFELHADPNLEDLIAAALRGSWNADVLKASNLRPSFTIERFLDGATDSYFRFTGSHVNSFALNIEPEEFVTGTLGITGIGHSASASAIAGATVAAAATPVAAPPLVGVDVSAAAVSSVTGVDFMSISIELDNNNRVQRKLASAGGAARGVGYGRRAITGSIVSYFDTLAHYNQFLANDAPSITVTMSDGSNNYTITLPRVRFTGGEVPTPGIDQDIMLTMQYQAIYDPTLQTSMQISRA